ncbi:MAG: Peptide methionine sulfoxide reductase [Candidatus Methanohalarchaeum thermophilum]|uniref:Peptide methionine sulfoxide reductase MsrA n=1 Tax=Methanohalarchaeum thermophilum TaxID=1903181 RepID=A0A1Q6DVS8_METT1|nr:MAG: Peptide methionine sulfoxide reductase [Candidatus Methanohalarchaeum thermophilum]
MEAPFKKLDGVKKVTSGYTGGKTKNPTYNKVCKKNTGHREAVQIQYDPKIVDYNKLLNVYWRQIDPTDESGQFADRGDQYKTAIFYHSKRQKELATESKKKIESLDKFCKEISTEILPFDEFYEAEERHQNFHEKNPKKYKKYRCKSGRDQFLKEKWSEVTPT